MKSKHTVALLLFTVVAVLALPLLSVRAAAGGRIEGTVTDPKGAAVVGAAVTVTDPETGQTFRSVTDGQGHYRVGGLAAATYVITISANGFSEFRRAEIKVVFIKLAFLALCDVP